MTNDTIVLVVEVFSAVLCVTTLASIIKWDDWWIRVFDFPRIQIASLIIITLIISIYIYSWERLWQIVLTVLMVICLIYQGYRIVPYTLLWKKQVRKFKGSDESRSITILISNVLTTNRKTEKLIRLVKKEQPQIVLTLESDQWWEDQLQTLEQDYPYTVKVPLDNLYGMHLYSQLELAEYKVNYLVQQDIPSIEALIVLPSGDKIRLYCLHPMPPSPTESATSTDRDAEILLVGRKIKEINEPVLVIGDLNDVAWSYTTRLFQRISGLLDPRIGRGFFNTFHASYPFLRWPLDHVFHSATFEHIRYRRLANIGSDHFPILTKLYLQQNREYHQDIPTADAEEKQEAKEKIKKADPIKEVVSSSKGDTEA